MNLRLCEKYDEQIWIELNIEFMNYEIQDSNLWNNTQNNSLEVFKHTFNEALANPDLIKLFIIEHDNEIIGFLNLMSVYSIWAHGKALIIDDLYITETYRRKGLGKQVLEYIELYAKENMYNRLQFQSELSNNAAYEFYTSIGYFPTEMHFFMKHL